MKLLFPIFRYFPHGGLQRDMLRIAEAALRRGHSVTICTMAWQSEAKPPVGLEVKILKVSGLSNHSRAGRFVAKVHEFAATAKFDLIVGFNRMPGLDIYFAADNCFAKSSARHPAWMRKVLPRYRTFLEYERAIFAPESKVRILYLAPRQKRDFIEIYGTQEERFTLLPPGISPDCRREQNHAEIREAKRAEFGVSQGEFLLLEVGSGYRTKGVDRTLLALSMLPENLQKKTKLFIAGREKSRKFEKLALKLGISNNVIFGGGRDDVNELLLAADLVVHPARNEAAGNVLIEAIAMGTPVICTANCGFSDYVEKSGGVVLPDMFDQSAFAASLEVILADPSKLAQMRTNAVSCGNNADFYRRADVAVDAIEEVCHG
ncbi:MAG: glycosyltransferase family 4 protein [Victivallales bacterium]|jgi:UDP-glucose:(heptosyl)LPS alpha-1,3-glucosyltransferase|nr:glycosyltransferase family 4 protein [Victivallales bacterium]